MREFLHLKHDGKTFERFMNDFCAVFNYCGGRALNCYYPADYHFIAGDCSYWVDTKEFHSVDNHIFSLKYYDSNTRFRDQVDFLADMQKAGHLAAMALWVVNWKSLAVPYPFITLDGLLLKYAATKKEHKRLHIGAGNIFNLYGLIIKTPNYKNIFGRLPFELQPYSTPSFPDIINYQRNPRYSALPELGIS